MSYGRRVIYTDEAFITAQNVVAEVNKALLVHLQNRTEIQVLYDYYRGITPILDKTKEIREEINHKVNENIAYEIVQFHKGFGFGEEIQCIRREASQHAEKAGEHSESDTQHDNDVAQDISALNGYLADADKHACDNEIAEWLLFVVLATDSRVRDRHIKKAMIHLSRCIASTRETPLLCIAAESVISLSCVSPM